MLVMGVVRASQIGFLVLVLDERLSALQMGIVASGLSWLWYGSVDKQLQKMDPSNSKQFKACVKEIQTAIDETRVTLDKDRDKLRAAQIRKLGIKANHDVAKQRRDEVMRREQADAFKRAVKEVNILQQREAADTKRLESYESSLDLIRDQGDEVKTAKTQRKIAEALEQANKLQSNPRLAELTQTWLKSIFVSTNMIQQQQATRSVQQTASINAPNDAALDAQVELELNGVVDLAASSSSSDAVNGSLLMQPSSIGNGLHHHDDRSVFVEISNELV